MMTKRKEPYVHIDEWMNMQHGSDGKGVFLFPHFWEPYSCKLVGHGATMWQSDSLTSRQEDSVTADTGLPPAKTLVLSPAAWAPYCPTSADCSDLLHNQIFRDLNNTAGRHFGTQSADYRNYVLYSLNHWVITIPLAQCYFILSRLITVTSCSHSNWEDYTVECWRPFYVQSADLTRELEGRQPFLPTDMVLFSKTEGKRVEISPRLACFN
jgi:hypothetical protein